MNLEITQQILQEYFNRVLPGSIAFTTPIEKKLLYKSSLIKDEIELVEIHAQQELFFSLWHHYECILSKLRWKQPHQAICIAAQYACGICCQWRLDLMKEQKTEEYYKQIMQGTLTNVKSLQENNEQLLAECFTIHRDKLDLSISHLNSNIAKGIIKVGRNLTKNKE